MEELSQFIDPGALMEAIDPVSLYASLTPVLVGSVSAFTEGFLDVDAFFSIFLFTACLHGAVNVQNFRQRLKQAQARECDAMPPDDPLEAHQIRWATAAMYGLGATSAVWMIRSGAWSIAVLGLGILFAYLRTAKLGINKFQGTALADLFAVCLVMPALTLATYTVHAGLQPSLKPLLFCLPVSSIYLAVLHAQNSPYVTPHMAGVADASGCMSKPVQVLWHRAQHESLSQMVGFQHSMDFFQLLVYGAQAVVFVCAYNFSFWLLLPLLTLLPFSTVAHSFQQQAWTGLADRTAALGTAFTLLLVVGILLWQLKAVYVVGMCSFIALCTAVYAASNEGML